MLARPANRVFSRLQRTSQSSSLVLCVRVPHHGVCGVMGHVFSTDVNAVEGGKKKVMSKVSPAPLRGTRDLFPDTTEYINYIESTFKSVLEKYGYNNEIRTPIIEHKDVFNSTLGEDSEVVMKQMYLFDDFGTPTVLRPENTASVIRSIVKRGVLENPSYSDKMFYSGPMFRRERPQAGRLRQFQQFGVECIGSDHAFDDSQVITMAHEALTKIKLREKQILAINSLGTKEERVIYEETQYTYLLPYKKLLSAESQNRMDLRKPLRVQDSKDPADVLITRGPAMLAVLSETPFWHNKSKTELVHLGLIDESIQFPLQQAAPVLLDTLGTDSTLRFHMVCQGLDRSGVTYVVDKYLLRGLDYYCHTAFEFLIPLHDGMDSTAVMKLGTIPPLDFSAVLAGGRYNELSTRFGDKSGNFGFGVGWAAGVDRQLIHLQNHTLQPTLPKKHDVAQITMLPKTKNVHDMYAFMQTQPASVSEAATIITEDMKNTIAQHAIDKQSASEETAAIINYTAYQLSQVLRNQDIRVMFEANQPYRAQLSRATRAKYAVVLGEDEVKTEQVQVKDMDARTQEKVPFNQLDKYLLDKLQHIY